MTITIDGPAGSGKTSVARLLAQTLNIRVLQSGLLYRAAAVVLLVNRGVFELEDIKKDVFSVDLHDCTQVKDSLTDEEIAKLSCIEYGYQDDAISPYVKINGISFEGYLGKFGVGLPASVISQHLAVRDWALSVQRAIAKKYDLIAEGRDCGTVVFPEAEYKFFLTASLEVRKQRVAGDNSRGIVSGDAPTLAKSILARDEHDQTRKIAPLVAAHTALIVDASHMNLHEVVSFLLQKMGK